MSSSAATYWLACDLKSQLWAATVRVLIFAIAVCSRNQIHLESALFPVEANQ